MRRRQLDVGGMSPRSAKMEILTALVGRTLYSEGRRTSRPTDEFRPHRVAEPARGMRRIDINEPLLHGA